MVSNKRDSGSVFEASVYSKLAKSENIFDIFVAQIEY